MIKKIYLVSRSLRSKDFDTTQHSHVLQMAFENVNDAYRYYNEKKFDLFEQGYKVVETPSTIILGEKTLPEIRAFRRDLYVVLSIKLIFLYSEA